MVNGSINPTERSDSMICLYFLELVTFSGSFRLGRSFSKVTVIGSGMNPSAI
jgi:hypothetical protein